jgi:flagellar M-ring protein FliF
MDDLVPAGQSRASPPSLLAPLTDPAGGPALTRLRSFTAQEPVRRMLPWFIGLSALGGAALAWSSFAPAPQRTLYSQLSDSERSSVVSALDTAAIAYSIDNTSGALTVAEDDYYRARMLVASEGNLAAPESGDQILDAMPMGASRTLEGERVRSAREHDLMLSILEIDGVESVRVHLAEGEKSVFVRENVAPTASVMVRLARGRQLAESQVSAIVNLVAGSVPGLTPEAVRVIDQRGRLLSDKTSKDSDRLELQTRMEAKLRDQVAQLLTPMLGEGNFTSEIQLELDMDQVTSARESYEKEGAVRSETQAQSQSSAAGQAAGIPGVLSNTPPPAATPVAGAPQGTAPAAAAAPATNGETSTSRNYELGREVSVANAAPGKVKRLSVAVAISAKAMKGGKPADMDQIKQLVSAAVGADAARGDQVAVVARSFEPVSEEGIPFYETPWFAMVVRYGAGLLAVLLVLLLGVRPLIRAFKREPAENPAGDDLAPEQTGEDDEDAPGAARKPAPPDPAMLSQQVGLAQRIVAEQPDNALVALRQMLAQPGTEAAS